MVDQRHPSQPAHPTVNSSAASSQPSRFRSYVRVLVFAGLPILVIVIAFSFFSGSSSESEVLVNNKPHTIQLDVLNATGEAKLAQRLTEFLRQRGFDVVEIGNYAGDLSTTLVIDRTGNRDAAVRVARSIGLPEERVIQKIDRTLYLDVSVYIGDDFQTLRPFK